MRLDRRLTMLCMAMVVGLAATTFTQAPKTDEEFDKVMKQVGPSNGALRKHLEGQMGAEAGKEAAKLAMLFKDSEAFWTARQVTDAAEWSKAAIGHAQNVEKAIAANDMAKATEASKALGGMCMQCHTKYRDKAPDGTWRIKPQP